eukprot:CAMPEP_0195041848 /NCGR_PEP_ID=MMETSP0347-20130606/1452_1 /TAXON_ID=2932 /ORGANISM="Alexandrium fundyense, Strain CCMP1719" /LENGTH=46 /DNA_ID= /DNA_START= /DNA_END= /DNA_ORIENTATION=
MAPLTMVAPVAQKAPWKNQVRKVVLSSQSPSMTKLVPPENLFGSST